MFAHALVNTFNPPPSPGTAPPPSDEDANADADASRSGRRYDLAVIGAGVVGAQAALVAAQAPYNRNVILIDAPRASGMLMNEATDEDLSLGGPTGLFSKALRDTSKRIKVSTLRGMGLREDSVWNEIVNSCADLAHSNAQDIMRQLEMSGVDYYRGLASFLDDDASTVRIIPEAAAAAAASDAASVSSPVVPLHEVIRADKILIATGSQPFRPAGIPFDGVRIFDSDSINTLSYLPKSIAITGSGIIAVEFAKIFRNLGAEVTLIIRDLSPRNALMKIGLDKDVAATLVADLVRSGISIERGARVKSFEVPKSQGSSGSRLPIKVLLESKDGGALPNKGARTEVLCDAYLAAVGRKPNTELLGLDVAGIQVDEYGGVLVDSKLCSTAKKGNVFAAGDVLGRPFLASTGTAQGIAAIRSMFATTQLECPADDPTCRTDGIAQAGAAFDPASLASNPFAFPTGVWSSPEAAYYGFSLQQAQEKGITNAGEAMALYAECLRGRVFAPNGLLKLVFEKPAGRILGVHICGDDACELIHYGMELVKGQRTIADLNSSLFSAVTYHEMYKIAAQAALDEAGARKRRAAAGAALAKRNRQTLAKEKA